MDLLLRQEERAHDTLGLTTGLFEQSHNLPPDAHLRVEEVTPELLQDARIRRALVPLSDPATLLARCP